MRAIAFAIATWAAAVAGCSADNAAVAKARAAQAGAEAELARIRAGAAVERHTLDQKRMGLVEAFNRLDAKAWASVYADDADLIHEGGETFKGRAAIEAFHAKFFADNPGMRVKAGTANERFITPGIMLEDGFWEVGPRQDGGATQGRHTTVWVHRNGQWALVSHRGWVPLKAPDK